MMERKGEIPRVSPAEFYPFVGNTNQALERFSPILGSQLTDLVKQALQIPQIGRVVIEIPEVNDSSKVRSASIEKPDPTDGTLTIGLRGDWAELNEVPAGDPLIASFTGRFYRKMKPTEKEPIADIGSVILPDQEIGIASKGKGSNWPYTLPPQQFPNGAQIAKFNCPVDDQGITVVEGETIICLVKKL
jgi:hypothetical protein